MLWHFSDQPEIMVDNPICYGCYLVDNLDFLLVSGSGIGSLYSCALETRILDEGDHVTISEYFGGTAIYLYNWDFLAHVQRQS